MKNILKSVLVMTMALALVFSVTVTPTSGGPAGIITPLDDSKWPLQVS